jgi:hypothetical protein
MKAEKLLKISGIHGKTIPVPRKLSSDCGLAISISGINLDGIRSALKEEPAEETYQQENTGFRRVI